MGYFVTVYFDDFDKAHAFAADLIIQPDPRDGIVFVGDVQEEG
jgi:hypothetical protein